MTEEDVSIDSRSDRLMYLFTESQTSVAALIVTAGALLVWFEPSIPRVPTWMRSAAAAVLILGPPLWIAGMRIVDWLRVRDWVTVFHINAIEDEREKYLVPPALWEEKTVEGPPPHPVNGGAAWEVRQFEFSEAEDDEEPELIVSGTWMSATSDSKLLTSKAMLEDVHNTLIRKALELSKLRARIKRMGVQIQESTVMQLAEQDERGTMLNGSAVQEAFEAAKEQAEQESIDDEMPEIGEFADKIDALADGGQIDE